MIQDDFVLRSSLRSHAPFDPREYMCGTIRGNHDRNQLLQSLQEPVHKVACALGFPSSPKKLGEFCKEFYVLKGIPNQI